MNKVNFYNEFLDWSIPEVWNAHVSEFIDTCCHSWQISPPYVSLHRHLN